MSQTEITLPYRPCVGIVLINRDGLVWAGHRVMGDLPPDAPRWLGGEAPPENARGSGEWQPPS